MMNRQEDSFDFDYIEQYLKGELAPQEKAEFENRMKNDPALAEEVSLHKDIIIGLETHFNSNLKSKLQQVEKEQSWQKEEEPEKEGRMLPFNIRPILAVAASLLILLVAGYLFIDSTPNNQELFAAYYQPYPNIVNPVERSADKNLNDQGLFYYENGDYFSAIRAFENQLATDPANVAWKFYRGVSLLQVDKAESAAQDLRQVIQSNNIQFVVPAQWYLGLATLKMGNKGEAVAIFEKLAQSDNGYATKAQRILAELD